jgi:tRNA(fMet)-specific endonuclease VapC
MATLLLDSSVIFDHLNSRSGRTEHLMSLLDQGHTLACCAVNITEVYAGLRPGEEPATKLFLDTLDFFPITREVARSAGSLRRKWRQKGQTLSYTDVTIAAVAIENGVALLTDNRKHFPMSEIELFALPRS